MNPDNLARLRQGVYRLLGAGLAPPSADTIGHTIASIPVLEDLGLFDFAFSTPLVDYTEQLAAADLDQLVAAYMALFEVGVGGASCPPTESAWLANPHTGNVAVIHSDLRRTYLRYGLRPAGPLKDTIDHATVELDVMSSLCESEAVSLGAGRPIERARRNQREFLNVHLGRWIPGFARAVERTDRHPAYTALARSTHAYLVHDVELLAILGAGDDAGPQP
ncbi:MAG: molecular chaperone TorD family protein [Acidimicrobiia bacterium]